MIYNLLHALQNGLFAHIKRVDNEKNAMMCGTNVKQGHFVNDGNFAVEQRGIELIKLFFV
jgi:hypothetical protein